MCKVLLWIFPNILGNCQKNNKVQQIAAVASDIASAAYTPATPIKCGNINANGINRIALRNKAMKIEIFACPKATNIFWQAQLQSENSHTTQENRHCPADCFYQSFITRKGGSYC